jgi:hypothetical protein
MTRPFIMNTPTTPDELLDYWPGNIPFKGGLVSDDGTCMCAQGQALHFLDGVSPAELHNYKQAAADKRVAELFGISRAHAVLLRIINDGRPGAPSVVIRDPAQVLGDQAETVLAFWRHLDRMTTEQWRAVRAAAGAAAGAAAWAAAWDAAGLRRGMRRGLRRGRGLREAAASDAARDAAMRRRAMRRGLRRGQPMKSKAPLYCEHKESRFISCRCLALRSLKICLFQVTRLSISFGLTELIHDRSTLARRSSGAERCLRLYAIRA